jgi:hypothetical protein
VAGNQATLTATQLKTRGFPSTVSVKAGDHVVPQVTGPSASQPTGGPITVSFNEVVNGISGTSATVRKGGFPDPGPVVAGSWTCQTGAGAATSCATGQVRKASFTPTSPLDTFTSYQIELNPEGSLSVRDLGGNPFDRRLVFFFTGS